MRAFVNGPVGEALMARLAGRQIALLERDVRSLGRSFGEHSMGLGRGRD
jgi:hypothetical protein